MAPDFFFDKNTLVVLRPLQLTPPESASPSTNLSWASTARANCSAPRINCDRSLMGNSGVVIGEQWVNTEMRKPQNQLTSPWQNLSPKSKAQSPIPQESNPKREILQLQFKYTFFIIKMLSALQRIITSYVCTV